MRTSQAIWLTSFVLDDLCSNLISKEVHIPCLFAENNVDLTKWTFWVKLFQNYLYTSLCINILNYFRIMPWTKKVLLTSWKALKQFTKKFYGFIHFSERLKVLWVYIFVKTLYWIISTLLDVYLILALIAILLINKNDKISSCICWPYMYFLHLFFFFSIFSLAFLRVMSLYCQHSKCF